MLRYDEPFLARYTHKTRGISTIISLRFCLFAPRMRSGRNIYSRSNRITRKVGAVDLELYIRVVALGHTHFYARDCLTIRLLPTHTSAWLFVCSPIDK